MSFTKPGAAVKVRAIPLPTVSSYEYIKEFYNLLSMMSSAYPLPRFARQFTYEGDAVLT